MPTGIYKHKPWSSEQILKMSETMRGNTYGRFNKGVPRPASQGKNNYNWKHGYKGTVEYNCWQNMKRRCDNPKHIYYKNYGGRGITVCERWFHSFENFYNDMGDKPNPELTIDRINNNGNYEPSNCRWATRHEQNQNQRVYKIMPK